MLKLKQLSNNSEFYRKVEKDRDLLKEVIDRFPFRQKPELIDELTPESLYNPGGQGYW